MEQQLDLFRDQPVPEPAKSPDPEPTVDPPRQRHDQLTELPGTTFEDIFA